jgi:predicted AlkP superfamily pyrophosphatase or phosphodiesterase
LRNAAAQLVAALVATGCLSQSPLPAKPAPPPSASRQGSGGINLPQHQNAPHVVLISLDGVRADYLDSDEAQNLRRIAWDGVRAAALVPVFPTMTFPNHISLVTGLHPDRHGIVGNSFYDPDLGRAYTMSDQTETRDGSWYRGEPIWVTAERQGMVSACFFWPSSDAPIGGVRPTHWSPYDGKVPNQDRVDTVLEWLRRPADSRPHLITLYMSDVDSASHRFGLGSPEVWAALGRVDRAIGRLLDGVAAIPRHDVYVVVTSDHGMADVRGNEPLDALIDLTAVRIGTTGPVANLHVTGGIARARVVRDALNRGLKHGRAFLRADVPARLRHSANPRIGDVVVIMDEGYLTSPTAKPPDPSRPLSGTHGWDPALPSMHAIFLVSGPGVRRAGTIPAVRTVDVYPFLTELLRLRAASGIDGRASAIASVVLEPRSVR